MPEVPVAYSFDGFALQDPQQLLRVANERNLPTNLWLGKGNRFILPKGKNPGIGWLLMLQKEFSEVDLDETNHVLRFEQGGPDPQKLELKDLTIVKADAIYAPGIIVDGALYLVEITDKRHLFLMSAINKDYNVLSPDGSNFFDDSLNGGSEFTWQEVLDDLWNFLPTVRKPLAKGPQLLVDPLNDFQLTTDPQNLRFRGISAWEAINIVLDRLNYAAILDFDGVIKYEPEWEDIFDTLAVVGTKSILDDAIKASKALDVSLSQQGTVPRIPEKIRVFFPSTEPATASGGKFLLEKSASTVDTTSTTILPDAKPSPFTVMVIWDEMEATFDENGVITNQSDLNTRAADISKAFLKSDPSEQADSRLFIGILKVLPGTFAAFVMWGDIGSGLMTETGQEIPGVIRDRKTEPLTPMINREADAVDDCGDLLAGFTPNQANDSQEPMDAGTASPIVTLTSDDVPIVGSMNTVFRAPGIVNKWCWRFDSISGTFTSVLFSNESPNHLDISSDFSVRFLFNSSDNMFATNKTLWDFRGGIVLRINFDGFNETFQVKHFDGTSTTFSTFSGLTILENVWYAVHFRWESATQTIHLQVTAISDEVIATVQTFVIGGDPSPFETRGWFVGDSADGSGTGYRGRLDGLHHFQKFLQDCDTESDFNGGRMSAMPAANRGIRGVGKVHERDFTEFVKTTDASTVEILRIPVPAETTLSVFVHVSAIVTNGSGGGAFIHHFAAKNQAAFVSFVGIGSTLISSLTDFGGSLSASVSSSDLIISVVGGVGDNIRWHIEAFDVIAM